MWSTIGQTKTMGFIERDNKIYVKILSSDGTMRIPTNESDPDHIKRVEELKNGETKTYIEKIVNGYKGKIKSINFREMEFGKMINIVFENDEENKEVVLSMNCNTNFAKDFMEKLPNINLEREVSISPWSMTKDNGKTSKGMVVWQTPDKMEEGSAKVKVQSFFREYEEGKRPMVKNGFPEPRDGGKGFDNDDWRLYFTEVKKFLIKYTEENILSKMIGFRNAVPGTIDDVCEKEISADDIPM